MSAAPSYYNRAAFRPGVDVLIGDTRALFTYDLLSFDIDLNAAAASQVERLCDALGGAPGLVIDAVETDFGAFTPHVWEILAALDKYGFLTERGEPNASSALSGAVFWNQVEAFANRCKEHFRPVLYPALAGGTVARWALTRYALEYYHLVRQGPSIIAGALAHVGTDRTRTILERFLTQEIGHDQLLLRALAAAGVGERDARASLPLPETFAVAAGLQTLADQDPLSFKAVAFLLEESSGEFHAAFREASERVGLGQGFWSPIVRHAEINDDGDHGRISAQLLAEVPAVSAEQRVVVLKHVATLIESLVALEHAVLDPRNGFPPGPAR
jgi:hypothetical protein